MNVVDLFAGAGGFSRGFINAGFEVVVAVENFKPVANTYRKNFPEVDVIERDVKCVRGDEIKRICGDVDVLIGSPPCEPFTPANVKRYPKPEDRLYQDKIGRLTLHFIRLVKETSPKVFIMENVPGILDLKNALIEEFRKTGYEIHFNILRAEDFENPSMRTRVFISNVRICPERSRRRVRVIDAIGDLPEPNCGIPNHEAVRIPRDKLRRIRNLRWGESLVRFEGAGGYYRNWIRLHPYRLAPTVMGNSRFIHPFRDRLLTVREHARLMGFPDDHIFLGGREVQYDMVGEAVPVPLSTAIAKYIKTVLE